MRHLLVGIQDIQHEVTAGLVFLSFTGKVIDLSFHNGDSVVSFKAVHINVPQSVVLLIHFLEDLPGDVLANFLFSVFVLLLRHGALGVFIVQVLPHAVEGVLEFSLHIMVMFTHEGFLIGLANSVHTKFVLAILSEVWVSIFGNDSWCEEVRGLHV